MQRLAIFLLLAPAYLSAQTPKSHFAGARPAALAHTTVAVESIWAGHHNQAALAALDTPELGVSYQQRLSLQDLSLSHLSFAYPAEWGTLGLSLNYYGFNLYNETRIGLSYSRNFGPYFSAGLQLNYEQSYVSEGQKTEILTFETGLLAKPTDQIQIGFHLYNPTAEYRDKETNQRLPTAGRLGFLYRFSKAALLTAEVRKDLRYSTRYAAGFEYHILEFLSLQAGAGVQDIYFASGGLGFSWDSLTTNIACEYAQPPGNNFVFSLSYQF